MGLVVSVGGRSRDGIGPTLTNVRVMFGDWTGLMEDAVAWLVRNRELLPTAGTALDVACGRGRHALWLAAQGFRVTAVDRDATALGHLADEARARGGAGIVTAVLDLERRGDVLPADAFDVIVVVHYLHRPLFPQLVGALRVGGVLVYETFTTAQAARGKPTNPDFLLRPGELQTLVRPLEVLAAREGVFDGRDVASVVARRP
jgi:SAM-dependent methyltransferase